MKPLSVEEQTRAERTRKTLIRLAQWRQKPGSGSAAVFLRERTQHVMWPNLDEVLGDLPWAVVGAVATRLYMPERATRDLDVVVVSWQSDVAKARLRSAGWQHLGTLSIGGHTWRSPQQVEVDVLEGKELWWPQAIAQAQLNRDEQGLPVLPLPYLVLMKFQAGRTVDIGDITRMLGQADDATLADTRSLFQMHEPDGLDDLESLIELGHLEMQSENK